MVAIATPTLLHGSSTKLRKRTLREEKAGARDRGSTGAKRNLLPLGEGKKCVTHLLALEVHTPT